MSILDVKRKRDVKRQRGQFIAVAVTIGLGVMLFASTYDSYLNLDDSYNFTYDRLNFADITVIGANDGFAAQAADIEGVDQVGSRYEADIPFRVNGDIFLGRAIAYPPESQPAINKIDVSEGEYLDPDDPSQVVIEDHMSRQFELEVGDTFEIGAAGQFYEVTVAGVAFSSEYIWPARSSQEIFPPPGTFGVAFVSDHLLDQVPDQLKNPDVLITYDDGADVEATDALVETAAESAEAGDVIPRAEHPSHETLQLDVDGFQQLAIMFPALFMSAAGLASFILLTRLVIAQRSQIGTMRASGMGRRKILRHYLSYGTRLGIGAGLFGLVIGIAAGFAISQVYTSSLGIPDTVTAFHPITPLIGLAFGWGAGALGAYAPARRAFKLSPAEAMRGDIPPRGGSRSLFEKILPPLRRLPVRWLMALRGIGRSKRRSLSTVIGVVLALMLVLVSWGFIDSMRWLIDRQFNEVSTEDASVILTVLADDDGVADVADVDGVTYTEVVSTLEVSVRFGSESYRTAINAYSPDSQTHEFPDGLPSEGVLAGSAMADQLGVDVGDQVTVRLETLDSEFTTELVGFLDEPVGTYLYVDSAFLEGQVEDPSVLLEPGIATVRALFAEGVDRERVIDDIHELDTVAGVVDSRLLVDLIADFTAFFYAFIGIMVVMGGAMAFALMFNTISVNVAERAGEFATMRANGLSHNGIAAIIAFENLLLTILGVVPGVLIGWVTGIYFMSSYSTDALVLEFRLEPLSIVIAVVAMILTAALSLIPALRTIRRLDIGKVVRERAA